MEERKYLKLSFESEIAVMSKLKEMIKKEVDHLGDSKRLSLYVSNVSEIINNKEYLYYLITEFGNNFKEYIYENELSTIEESYSETMYNTRNRIMVIVGSLLDNPTNEVEDEEKLSYATFIDTVLGVFLASLIDIIILLKEEKFYNDYQDRCKYLFYSTLDEFYSYDYAFNIDYGILEIVLESIIADEYTDVLSTKKGIIKEDVEEIE